MVSVVEKKKTGDFFAAKIVSKAVAEASQQKQSPIEGEFEGSNSIYLGKSHQVRQARDALLGEQAHSQTQRQK
jgi:hypothetical protein